MMEYTFIIDEAYYIGDKPQEMEQGHRANFQLIEICYLTPTIRTGYPSLLYVIQGIKEQYISRKNNVKQKFKHFN